MQYLNSVHTTIYDKNFPSMHEIWVHVLVKIYPKLPSFLSVGDFFNLNICNIRLKSNYFLLCCVSLQKTSRCPYSKFKKTRIKKYILMGETTFTWTFQGIVFPIFMSKMQIFLNINTMFKYIDNIYIVQEHERINL